MLLLLTPLFAFLTEYTFFQASGFSGFVYNEHSSLFTKEGFYVVRCENEFNWLQKSKAIPSNIPTINFRTHMMIVVSVKGYGARHVGFKVIEGFKKGDQIQFVLTRNLIPRSGLSSEFGRGGRNPSPPKEDFTCTVIVIEKSWDKVELLQQIPTEQNASQILLHKE